MERYQPRQETGAGIDTEVAQLLHSLEQARNLNHQAKSILIAIVDYTRSFYKRDNIAHLVKNRAESLWQELQSVVLSFAQVVNTLNPHTVHEKEIRQLFDEQHDLVLEIDSLYDRGVENKDDLSRLNTLLQSVIMLGVSLPSRWEQVKSIHQAIQFLHTHMYASPAYMLHRFVSDDRKNNERIKEMPTYTILDLSSNGWENTESGSVIQACFDDMDPPQNLQLPKPFIFITDQYVECSFPTGSHRYEISLEVGDNTRQYGCVVSLWESGCIYSMRRAYVLKGILSKNAFTTLFLLNTAEGSVKERVVAHAYTNQREQWERQLTVALRLGRALPELDLDQQLVESAETYFKKGITNMSVVLKAIMEIEQLIDSKAAVLDHNLAARIIFVLQNGGSTEVKYVTQVLYDTPYFAALENFSRSNNKDVQGVVAQILDIFSESS